MISSPQQFYRDDNRVPDTNTARGQTLSYEDDSFVAGDSPVVLDIVTDLGYASMDGYIVCDGDGDILIEFEEASQSSYGGQHTIKKDEVVCLKGMYLSKIRITHSGTDSAYRAFVV